MGIRLDWDIEAERVHQRAGEDPELRKIRRMQRIRILLFTFGMLAAFCAFGAVIWYRLYTVDQQLKRDLINTVQAEVTTLRVGNFAQYIAIQRVAPNGDWYQVQSERFMRYQDLIQKGSIKLTGAVVDTIIDSERPGTIRAQAVVEEIKDGVPNHALWTYWHYEDGWRHVPTDYTFWGESRTITGKVSTINYNQLDEALAQALSSRIDKWWAQGCGYVGCSNPPHLTVEIQTWTEAQWDKQHPFTLYVKSPLADVDRAPVDAPITADLENKIARLIADKAFSTATANLQTIPTADAAWLRQSTLDWLSATFVGRGNPVQLSFIQSMQDHYGTQGLVNVLHMLTPSSDISVVGFGLQQPMETLALDWRTFFQWRLDVEKTLVQQKDVSRVQALWDAANPTALAQMRKHLENPDQPTPQVQAVNIAPGKDGVARATVQATENNQPLVIVFRLVDGAWRRSA